MSELVVLTEEPSACDLLEGLLPRLLPAGWTFRCIPFEGKQDLEHRGPRLVRAWLVPGSVFVVLRDQDSGDCRAVKQHLQRIFQAPGRSLPLIRIACRELEAWIAGDLQAFAAEFDAAAARRATGKAKFRDPDALGAPVAELRQFVPAYQKRDGARRMGRRLDPATNRSHSFGVFCNGVLRLVGAP